MDPVFYRKQALAIWQAAVDAVRPEPLVKKTLHQPGLLSLLESSRRILVVGGGKACSGMASGLEKALAHIEAKIEGFINVPEGPIRHLNRIRMTIGRPSGVNFPTEKGVRGVEKMLKLLNTAKSEDVAICLLSGGGSALLPAPVEGVSLEAKVQLTKMLHACGATIQELNTIRKHLSRLKGGRLAENFRGKAMISLMISDVVGDPLDVIASGPTVADPSTFADCVKILKHYELWETCPEEIRLHFDRGMAGEISETPKQLPMNINNIVLANNQTALAASEWQAAARGYNPLNLGPFIEGDTQEVAKVAAGIVRSIRAYQAPVAPPACLLIGGETTVSLGDTNGKGGRNQEFALAMMNCLGADGMQGVTILSGGTDGEDGPTDAAGALLDSVSWAAIQANSGNISAALAQHNTYPFLDQYDALVRTGLTHTNVMDVRVILIV